MQLTKTYHCITQGGRAFKIRKNFEIYMTIINSPEAKNIDVTKCMKVHIIL